MYSQVINDTFVKNAGYNQLAEANNIIVLYPQTRLHWLDPSNPLGCFDAYEPDTIYNLLFFLYCSLCLCVGGAILIITMVRK
jgi:hypothetical protein